MRYLPVCTPAFAGTWFDGGATAESLATAPVIIFDRKDDLQDRYLRRFSRKPVQPPRHYVPAAHEFGEAIRLGMGWGLLPELEIGDDLGQGTLQLMASRSFVDVPLHWQQWRYGSAVLDGVAAAIQGAARVLR
ncbi:putative HTH-type transcriptional regulator [compost metagenome]